MEKRPVNDDEEEQAARLIRAALDAPSRPLRGNQVDVLVRHAAARRSPAVPGWVLGLLALGLLTIVVLGWAAGWNWTDFFALALVIPLVNLAASPIAAYVIVKRAMRHPADKQP